MVRAYIALGSRTTHGIFVSSDKPRSVLFAIELRKGRTMNTRTSKQVNLYVCLNSLLRLSKFEQTAVCELTQVLRFSYQ